MATVFKKEAHVSTRETMNINQHEAAPVEAAPVEDAPHAPRREALRHAGLLAGGALLGSAMLKTAHAQDAMPADPAMPQGGTMMAPGAMGVNPFGDLANFKTDVDILNFALILEYLEADYYTRVVDTQNSRAYLKRDVPMIAQKLRDDEQAHVRAITARIQQLGGTPVASPSFQFPAETFISEVAFLDFAAVLEQTGVHAYLGAAPSVKSRDVLRFAVSIYGIEARHTGLIRFAGGRVFAPSATESPYTSMQVIQAVTPFIIAA